MKLKYIDFRLLLTVFLVAMLPLLGLAWFYLASFERALAEAKLQNLSSIADKKAEQIANYIGERLSDADAFGRRQRVQDALLAYHRAFQHGGLAATKGVDRSYHNDLASMVESGKYYDLLLIDKDGEVVFSVMRESDRGSNLYTGPYRDTGLAQGFRQAMRMLQTDFTSFAPYTPSNKKVASFVVAPIMDAGRPIGAVALQINLDALTGVVSDLTGLGHSGETVLAKRVQDDVLYTAPLKHVPDAAFRHLVPFAQAAPAMRKVLSGEHGSGISTDYAGVEVVAAWRYLPALNWGMVVKTDAAEDFALARETRWLVLGGAAFFLFFAGTAAVLLNRRFSHADRAVRESEERFAKVFRSNPVAVGIRRLNDDLLIDWNPAFEKMINYSREQLQGKHIKDLPLYVYPEQRATVLEKIDRREQIHGMEIELRRATGESTYLLMTVDYITLRGEECSLASFVDVTEIKQANESVKTSRDQLNEAQRIAKLGSWTLDLRNNQLEWTDEIFRIFEIDREKFSASYDAFLNLIHPEDREMVNRAYTESVANRTPYEIDHRLLFADGRIKYVQERCETVYSDDGTAILSRGTVQDITERHRTEMAIREAKQLIDSVVENIPSMIFMKRADDLRFVMMNKAGEKLLGMSREELLGKNDFDFFVQEQAEFFAAKDREVLAQGFVDIPEEPIDTRVQGRRILHTRKIALNDGQGKPQYLLGISDDITEHKQYEEALKEGAQHIQAVFDNVVDGIITIDDHGSIASFNKAAERLFGYQVEEVIGRNVKMLMPKPYSDEHDGYLRNYQATGVARVIGIGREVEGRRKNGSVFPMDLAISEITRHGKQMFIGMVRDITERKRVERMKSEFVSTVSHELRTPLTSIAGALGLLAGGALGSLPEQAKGLIDIAHNNSLRLSHLINDLLDMEKIAAGKMHFDMQVLALMPLVEQALEANKAYGEQFQVRFVIAEKSAGTEVRGDSQRLMQVLSNFLSNAAKFSPQGGQVEVAVKRLDGRARVEVTDHGPGIPAAFRERIFQKFSQADSSDTRQKGGTGLGLAISKELMERMGGSVGFNSVEGQGASFYFELPLADEKKNELSAKFVAGIDPAAPSILVVEDDPDVAQLLALLLQRAGYHVDIAASGGQALRNLENRHYAAMTLDLQLPDIGGLEIIRQVRSRPRTENLPIIVVSASMEEGRLAINGDFSTIDWLPKPISERQLLTAVEKVLPQDLARRPKVLHVEDDADLHRVIRSMAGERFDFDLAPTLAQAEAMLASARYDVVILDLNLPDGSGWDLLPRLRKLESAPQVIILSGTELTPEESAKVEAVLLKSRVSSRELLDVLNERIKASSVRNTFGG